MSIHPRRTLRRCLSIQDYTKSFNTTKWWNKMKKTSMPDSIKSVCYIKCCCPSSGRDVESSSNSIIHHCQKIGCRMGSPQTTLKVSKNGRFFKVPYKFIIDQFSKDLIHSKKKAHRTIFFCLQSLSSIFILRNHRQIFH